MVVGGIAAGVRPLIGSIVGATLRLFGHGVNAFAIPITIWFAKTPRLKGNPVTDGYATEMVP